MRIRIYTETAILSFLTSVHFSKVALTNWGREDLIKLEILGISWSDHCQKSVSVVFKFNPRIVKAVSRI